MLPEHNMGLCQKCYEIFVFSTAISSYQDDMGTGAYGSGLVTCLSFVEETSIANLSTTLLPLCPTCAGIQISTTKLDSHNLFQASFAPAVQVLSTVYLLTALMAAWLGYEL